MEINVEKVVNNIGELTYGNSVDSLSATFENTCDANKPSTPPTGDKSNLMTWFVLMMISGSALVALIVYDRKLRKI